MADSLAKFDTTGLFQPGPSAGAPAGMGDNKFRAVTGKTPGDFTQHPEFEKFYEARARQNPRASIPHLMSMAERDVETLLSTGENVRRMNSLKAMAARTGKGLMSMFNPGMVEGALADKTLGFPAIDGIDAAMRGMTNNPAQRQQALEEWQAANAI